MQSQVHRFHQNKNADSAGTREYKYFFICVKTLLLTVMVDNRKNDWFFSQFYEGEDISI